MPDDLAPPFPAPVETAPPGPPSSPEPEAPSFALVVAASASEPHRIGEIAFFPLFEDRLLAPKAIEDVMLAQFARQRPGHAAPDGARGRALTGKGVAQSCLYVSAMTDSLEIEQIGACTTLVNGRRVDGANVAPGDTVLLDGDTLLVCVRRQTAMPPLRRWRDVQYFGEPDKIGMVGESPAAWELRYDIAYLAGTSNFAFIHGEPGTGKGVVSAAIHRLSSRADRPFVSLEAAKYLGDFTCHELFGNVEGYPKAGLAADAGLYASADQGTLVFDEVGAVPGDALVLLHRVLDDGCYQIYGEQDDKHADVRMICTTSRALEAFTIAFVSRMPGRVRTPPLRERPEDIPLLIHHTLRKQARAVPEVAKRFFRKSEYGTQEPNISARLVDHLVRHPLPGNVPELEAKVLEALATSKGDQIDLQD